MTRRTPEPARRGPAASPSGGLALFVSALQGSLAVGSAAGGLLYDSYGPGGVLLVAAVIAALGALTLLSRAGVAISSPRAGSVDLAGERGGVAAVSHGPVEEAASRVQGTC